MEEKDKNSKQGCSQAEAAASPVFGRMMTQYSVHFEFIIGCIQHDHYTYMCML